jgi:hypothetical protein
LHGSKYESMSVGTQRVEEVNHAHGCGFWNEEPFDLVCYIWLPTSCPWSFPVVNTEHSTSHAGGLECSLIWISYVLT